MGRATRRVRPDTAASEAPQSQAWREELFRAICADHAVSVRRILRDLGMLEDGRIDQMIFGVLSEVDRARGGRKLFLGYGAHAEDRHHHGFVKHGATCLHVAVWKNSLRVARLLSSVGASTGKEDASGCSAFARARTPEMRSILCRPAAPRDLRVISCERGKALLQWTASQSKPKVDLFEVQEELSQQRWSLDATRDVSRFTLTEDREGPAACLFETPSGSVHSAAAYKFAVRSRNEDGYWSEWCWTQDPVQSKHWVAEWEADERSAESRRHVASDLTGGKGRKSRRADRNRTRPAPGRCVLGRKVEEKRKKLLLGSRDFGFVRESDWFRAALEQQALAATAIQSILRAYRQRKSYVEQAWIQRRALRRSGAARVIQKFYQDFVSAEAQQQRQAHQAQARARARSSSISLPHMDVQSSVVSKSQKELVRSARNRQRLAMEEAIRRESERLEFLKQSGCDFMATLPDPWH